MTSSIDFLNAFKRNCPKVRMIKEEENELQRLFQEAIALGILKAVTPDRLGEALNSGKGIYRP